MITDAQEKRLRELLDAMRDRWCDLETFDAVEDIGALLDHFEAENMLTEESPDDK